MGAMLAVISPWCPFVLACMGRALAALSALLWVEGNTFGLCPDSFRSLVFYGAVAFMGQAFFQPLLAGLLNKPLPDMRITSDTGSFFRDTVCWAACGMRGWRDAMEDAHVAQMLDATVFPEVALFAVLDGHGGKEVSMLASKLLASEVEACGREQLAEGAKDASGAGSGAAAQPACLQSALEQALPRLDARLRRGWLGLGGAFPTALHPFCSMGSTACVAAVDLRSREVVCANVGDSRAILVRAGKAQALSEDHKPENAKERTRIRNAGGQVVKAGPCHRVDGNLNLSRALGDFYLKASSWLPPDKQKVIAVPDCTRTPFKGGPQELLIVACDGLFERRSNQDIADLVWPRHRSGMAFEQIGKEVLHACCARGQRGRPVEEGTDNESIVLVRLPAARDEASGGDDSSHPLIHAGARVEISGLESEAGRSLNGKAGIVEGATEGKAGRFDVRLAGGSKVQSFKAANLRVEGER